MVYPTIKDTMVLKIKYLDATYNSESLPFEEIISGDKSLVCINFSNGKSYIEKKFLENNNPVEKLFIELFDTIALDDILDYLMNPTSNYRVTNQEGTIIRPSHEDYEVVMEEEHQKVKQKKQKTLTNLLKKIVQKKGI